MATSGKLPLNIAAFVRIVCSACQMGGCSVVNVIRCYIFILLTRVESRRNKILCLTMLFTATVVLLFYLPLCYSFWQKEMEGKMIVNAFRRHCAKNEFFHEGFLQ